MMIEFTKGQPQPQAHPGETVADYTRRLASVDTLPMQNDNYNAHSRPFVAHLTKRGPAFERPLVVDIARSLQAQALQAAGAVLTAAGQVASTGASEPLKALLMAWQQLLEVVKPDVTMADMSRLTWMTRQQAGRDIQTVVLSALRHAEDRTGYAWQTADLIVRAAANREVTSLDAALALGTFEDGEYFTPQMVANLTSERDWFRRHADGVQ